MRFPKVGLTNLPGNALRALQSPNIWGDQAEMKRRGISQGAMWTPGRAALQSPILLRQLLRKPSGWNNARLMEAANRPVNPQARALAEYLLRQKYGPRG